MNETLSVIVPVFNAQNSLAKEVHELLDVLSDLETRFELVLVDDGSTDQTSDIADELAYQFPQIQIVRHPRRFGASAAIQSGLRRANGEIVFVQDEFTPFSAMELRRLWELRFDDKRLDTRLATPGALDNGLLRRLSDWGVALKKHSQREEQPRRGIQMIRRHVVDKMRSEQMATVH
ncbi:MAG: glycosyltransferase family 2 protein [Planctomycetales bacterium]|nr:glycosyltransferase family 2 protein [Planctomycetales bacterium]MCA9226270.1 glycosyltransferase family 2 protein [Planctomycetales bacterium]